MRFEGLVSADRMHELQAGQAVEFRVNGFPERRIRRPRAPHRRHGQRHHAAGRGDRRLRRPQPPRRAWPGSLPRAASRPASSQALTVPEGALQRSGEAAHVWRVDGTAHHQGRRSSSASATRAAATTRCWAAWPPATASCATRAARWSTASRSNSPAPAPPAASAASAAAASARQGRAAMFLSDFSIKRPVAMVVIIIGLMAPGPAGAVQAARQPDPRRRAAGAGGEHRLPRRVARDHRARGRQPHREVAAGHRRRRRGARHGRRGQRAAGADLQLRQEHGRGRRRGAQRHRLGAPQAADRDPRAGAAARRPGGAADHAAGAVVHDARRTPRSRAWPRTSWPTASAASRAWRRSTSTARCGANCRCCCTPRSCANSRSR